MKSAYKPGSLNELRKRAEKNPGYWKIAVTKKKKKVDTYCGGQFDHKSWLKIPEANRKEILDQFIERGSMSKDDRYEDPCNPFSSNYNGTPVGPDSFGGSDAESHYAAPAAWKAARHPDLGDPEANAIAVHQLNFELEKQAREAEAKAKTKEQEVVRKQEAIKHGWIQLYSGKKFYPLDPQEQDITIKDIAHSLANMCRFTGHCKKFYSVAQHCVLVSHLVDTEFALAALLHDASEAYLVDVPKPLKRLPIFEGYRELEHQLQDIIFKKFGWHGGEHSSIKIVDVKMLATEARDLMSPLHPEWKQPAEPYPFVIEALEPQEAEQLYLNRFRELILKQDNGVARYNNFIGE